MQLLVLEPEPAHGGGSEAVMLSLSRELAGRGHRIMLLHETPGSMLDEYRAFASEIVQAHLPGFALRAPLRTSAGVLRIGRIARARRVDAIVSSHLGFLRHAVLIRRLFGVPSCFHLGLSLVGAPRNLRWALPHMDAGVAPSAHSLESWKQGGWNPRTLHLVPNWVASETFAPASDRGALRRRHGMDENARHLVFVGRLCAQKGVDVLLQAFERIAAGRPDLHLHLVGPMAPDFAPLHGAAVAGLAEALRERVHTHPPTAHPEDFYAAADVVCAPSVGDEAFGLTVLEAMACAVPVVATRIGVLPEVIGDPALLAAPGDATSLAERLAWWIDQPALRVPTGARLRTRALENYGPAAGVDAYERILSDVARGSRRGA